MVEEKKEYNLRVELKFDGGYNQQVKSVLRENELYGGDPVLVSIKLTNLGSLPFSGVVRNFYLKESIDSGGEQWNLDNVRITGLNTNAEVLILNTYIVPLGEGLLTINFDVQSDESVSVKIEGRNSGNYTNFVYVHNRLLVQLLLKR